MSLPLDGISYQETYLRQPQEAALTKPSASPLGRNPPVTPEGSPTDAGAATDEHMAPAYPAISLLVPA